MHFLTKPGNLAAGGGPDHHRLGQGTAGDPRRAELRRPHRPGVPVRRTGRPGVRGELDQHRPEGRLRDDAQGRVHRHRRISGRHPRHADLPEGTRARSARRARATRSWCASTAPTERCCGPRRRRSTRRWSTSPAPRDSSPSRRPRCRRSRSAWIWPRPSSTASSPATSGAPHPRRSRARRSATSSGTARPTTSMCGRPLRTDPGWANIQNLPHRHPAGRDGTTRRGRRGRRAGPRELHQAREQRPQDRRDGGRGAGRDLGAAVRDVNQRWRRSSSPPATTTRCSATMPNDRRRTGICGLRAARRDRDLLPAAGLVQQLPTRRAVLR